MNDSSAKLATSSKKATATARVVIVATCAALIVLVAMILYMTSYDVNDYILGLGWKRGVVVEVGSTARTTQVIFDIDTGGYVLQKLHRDSVNDRMLNDLEVGDSIVFVRNSNIARVKKKHDSTWITVKKLRGL